MTDITSQISDRIAYLRARALDIASQDTTLERVQELAPLLEDLKLHKLALSVIQKQYEQLTQLRSIYPTWEWDESEEDDD